FIVGNTISNTHGFLNSGIFASASFFTPNGVEIANNVVHDNGYGIFGGKLVHNNRVYHNSSGIYAPTFVPGALTSQNVVYSNNIGIQTIGDVVNNLVYANTAAGIEVQPSTIDGLAP